MILSPIGGPPVSTFVYEDWSGATHLWLPLLNWPLLPWKRAWPNPLMVFDFHKQL